MVFEGYEVLEGYQDVVSGWSEEGCELIEVTILDETPAGSKARKVISLRLTWGIHPYSGGRGKADNATNIGEFNVVGILIERHNQTILKYLTTTMVASKMLGKLTYMTWLRFFMRRMATRVAK